MGTRKHRQRQEPLWYRAELAEAPGHPFYRRLHQLLEEADFDRFCESRCRQFYHERLGRPSLPPGMYFRLMLIGFFEGIDSERGIAWRVAERGLLKGKTIGIDATTLEANAAMRSIMRRDSGESYTEYLKRLAKAEGIEAQDAAALQKMDRCRPKKMSNAKWVNPHDREAEITRRKDGRTALAYKAEHAVDMETGAIVALTAHGGATGDTESVQQTLPAAGAAVGEQIATPTAEGEFVVNADGVEEVVADKGYHSGEVLAEMQAMEVRTYIAEPERGRRQWTGKEEQKAAVYRNRRRVTGQRGKALLRKRGEMLERPFAHMYETGRMRRLYVRGKINVQKKLLLQAAACNLALVLRQLLGAGTPRGLQDRITELFLLVFWITATKMAHPESPTPLSWCNGQIHGFALHLPRLKKRPAQRPV